MSDFVNKATGGWEMAHKVATPEEASLDSNQVHDIDMCCYANEAVPRGYVRTAPVEENASPNSCPQGKKPVRRPNHTPDDGRFINEGL